MRPQRLIALPKSLIAPPVALELIAPIQGYASYLAASKRLRKSYSLRHISAPNPALKSSSAQLYATRARRSVGAIEWLGDYWGIAQSCGQ